MNFKKFSWFLVCVCIMSLIFDSCSTKSYSSSSNCKELSQSLMREISVPDGEFSQYTDDELQIFFSSPELYDDISIIYSKDTTDIAELGILHAANEEKATKLFEEAKLYIKNLQEQKREFLNNYSPNEVQKLNSAEVRKFGNYIIFTVADPDDKNYVFSKAEELLKS